MYAYWGGSGDDRLTIAILVAGGVTCGDLDLLTPYEEVLI